MDKGKLNLEVDLLDSRMGNNNTSKHKRRVNTEERVFSKKKLFSKSTLLLIIVCCISFSVIKVKGTFRTLKDVSPRIVSSTSWGRFFGNAIPMGDESLFASKVVTYFKEQYSVKATVSEVSTFKEGKKDIMEAKVSVEDDSFMYVFRYVREEELSEVYDDFGAKITSRLLSAKLNELLLGVLPKNATINVVASSYLGEDRGTVKDIEQGISEWTLPDMFSYNKTNHLIREINIDILSGGESNLRKYSKKLLDIVTTLDSNVEGSPKLNVGFFKGKNSKRYVYEAIEDKYGVEAEDIDFSIDWYTEIKTIPKVKNYMYGAMCIDGDSIDILNNYIDNSEINYIDTSDKENSIYKKVSEIKNES